MELDEFTRSYIETALWSSCDDKDVPLDSNYGIEEIAEECLKQMVDDCKAFQETNAEWINREHCKKYDYTPAIRAGHDFWLTRCGHGAGFWDGDWSDEADKAMTTCSKAYGNVDLYVGNDGKIYC